MSNITQQMDGSTALTERTGHSLLVRVMAVTLFVSAFLLFWCEPMVGKMVLPLIGGTAAVWTTCILFFQIMLLAGYLYAHILASFVTIRRQFAIHTLVLLAALAFLPIHFEMTSANSLSGNPALWLLGRLFLVVGIPFFAIATNAPLLQNWLSGTTEESAVDPYFLYSASNAGSLVALLAHPLLLESVFGVTLQARLWLIAYIGLVGLVAVSMTMIWKRWRIQVRQEVRPSSSPKPTKRLKVYWVAVSFLPSALMLAVTNHVGANVTSAPFLWVVPLGMYLLTFILAFARTARVSSVQASRTVPIILLMLLVLPYVMGEWDVPGAGWLTMGIHIALLFVCALLCHSALAERRPDPEYLTEFYLWLALGGVLGGVFTAMIAPSIFQSVLEYPLIVAVILFFRTTAHPADIRKWGVPAAVGWFMLIVSGIGRWVGSPLETGAMAAAAIMFTLALYQLRNRPTPFAVICLIAVIADVVVLPHLVEPPRVYIGRNFFGVKTVVDDEKQKLRSFVHGNTIHGLESSRPELAAEPLAYYHREGPVGDVMNAISNRPRQNVGVIGLGAGSMAAYGSEARAVTFFEIDPDVETIARQYFQFLERCGSNCKVVVGDGRLLLGEVPETHFDLITVDAFSSDAVPPHLISREAVQLYLSKLAPDGVLLFNSTNRFLDIPRLVSALVVDAGLVAFIRRDTIGDVDNGRLPSVYVVAARHRKDLAQLKLDSGWTPVTDNQPFKIWTDDYSSLLTILRLR